MDGNPRRHLRNIFQLHIRQQAEPQWRQLLLFCQCHLAGQRLRIRRYVRQPNNQFPSRLPIADDTAENGYRQYCCTEDTQRHIPVDRCVATFLHNSTRRIQAPVGIPCLRSSTHNPTPARIYHHDDERSSLLLLHSPYLLAISGYHGEGKRALCGACRSSICCLHS